MMIGQEIECVAHSDINMYRLGTIISIAKDTVFIKFHKTELRNETYVEYPKSYLGKELKIIK